MKLVEAINEFYYVKTLDELRLMNENTLYPNISYNSLLYLDLISGWENCTVSKLAEALHISKSAVTLKVNELIKQGLVVKVQCEDDRRVNFLSVTPAVKEEYSQCDKKLLRAVQALSERYPEQDLDRVCDMLSLMSESYRE